MQSTHALKGLEYYRVLAFSWREKLSVYEKLMLSFVFAAFTGLMAQVRFYLPVTPILFTGQVFAVLLSAVILGRVYGGLSQVFYVSFGMMGVPWFTGGAVGSPLSPTTGYLLGFIAAAFFIGWVTDKTNKSHFFFSQILIIISGVLVIYCFGALYFYILTGTGLLKTLQLAVYPFIIFDIFKVISTALISTTILLNSPIKS